MPLSDYTQEALAKHINALVMPYLTKRLAGLEQSGSKFVHYTSAEAAVSIIDNNCLWLRNATLQNDFSEIQHGIDCLNAYWGNSTKRERFEEVVSAINPEAAVAIRDAMNREAFELGSGLID
jgi:hypothetical protein